MSDGGFPPNSRYARSEVLRHTGTDGRVVAYLARRFIPPPEQFGTLAYHAVEGGDRLDILADTYIGDPEQSWRLCDANGVLHPLEVTARIGREVRIGLPEGLPGVFGA